MNITPLRFTNAHEAATKFVRHGNRYKMIEKGLIEVIDLWRAVAEQHLQGSIIILPSDDGSTRFAGSVLGQPFSGWLSPVLLDGEVIGKLNVTKQGLDGIPLVCATYLFSFHTDILFENGQVLVTKNHDNFEFLWLCHVAEAVLAA